MPMPTPVPQPFDTSQFVGRSEAAPEQPGEFTKGVRSGWAGMRGQAHALAGGIGEATGFPEFAKGQYGDAQSAMQEAEATAPRVRSTSDIHGIRDFADWGLGTAGSVVPMGAAALEIGRAHV